MLKNKNKKREWCFQVIRTPSPCPVTKTGGRRAKGEELLEKSRLHLGKEAPEKIQGEEVGEELLLFV